MQSLNDSPSGTLEGIMQQISWPDEGQSNHPTCACATIVICDIKCTPIILNMTEANKKKKIGIHLHFINKKHSFGPFNPKPARPPWAKKKLKLHKTHKLIFSQIFSPKTKVI